MSTFCTKQIVNYCLTTCIITLFSLLLNNASAKSGYGLGPVIITQPVTQNLCDNSSTSATFSVTATGATSYQWRKNGAIISGATSSSYTANGLVLSDTSNTYSVLITNSFGSVTSNNASVHYVIITPPTGINSLVGNTINFSVQASGATGYQWYVNGLIIIGATANTYTKNNVTLLDAGNYSVVVYYPGGSCTSSAATLAVGNLSTINTQPQTQMLCSTSITTATFNVSASSVLFIITGYQWYKNGTAISGATFASYTATGLTLADTVNVYYVTVSNILGPTYSNNVGIKYVVYSQPSSLYIATGATASFTVGTSSATAFQWQKAGTNISGATAATFSKPSVALTDAGSYRAIVTYAGGNTCTSNAATLIVENLPAISTQPLQQVLCSSSSTSATFNVAASSVSALNYQWYKNGTAVTGATSAAYSPTGLTLADTANTYYVITTNGVGSTSSNNVNLKYLIVAQPSPASSYLATGNAVTFTAAGSNIATAFQWKKDGGTISGATASSYNINTVTTALAGNYTLNISYAGGSCVSNAGVLTTSTILYSKATGNINSPGTWGVATDGSGSTPVDFTRSEHTFIIANRATAATGSNLTIAGTFDVGNGNTTITGGTTFEAGRIIRSLATGTLSGTGTSALLVHGKSDLYFDASNKTLQTLTVASTDTVTLHTAVDIVGGTGHGIMKISSGVFYTGDLLTLKSDGSGTASIGNSSGTIVGKVTVERYIPARRAWRLFCSPVSAAGAPTIHDAWQEGALNSTDNPHPGYGTHITYGAESDGFDQNPQHTFSMKVYGSGGAWSGVPATNTTKVTTYPVYFIFIRGNRSYNITGTTNTTTPLTTILRTTGNLNMGSQNNVAVTDGTFGLINNPFASSVDFESIYSHSQNIAHSIWVWNPTLGGTKGVGAYVTVYWNGSGYSTSPSMAGGNNYRFIQANEGFFVQGAGSNPFVSFRESDKDTTNVSMPFGKLTEAQAQSKLAINLNVFNDDNTIGISDGVVYLFGNAFNSAADNDDIGKIDNLYENLGIASNNKLLTVEERPAPASNDSLQLSLTGTRSANYQFEFIPRGINGSLYLWDNYLHTATPINASDTSRITVTINTSINESKAADRFVILNKDISAIPAHLSNITATVKEQTTDIEWNLTNISGILYFDIERSVDGSNFSTIGSVSASANNSYSFTDNQPMQGNNYYRVKSVSANGLVSYTSIAIVVFESSNGSTVAVYPNPLTSNHCIITMHNKPAGTYHLKLVNAAGVVVFTSSLSVAGENCTLPISLPSFLAKGTYRLQVAGSGKKDIIKLVSVY